MTTTEQSVSVLLEKASLRRLIGERIRKAGRRTRREWDEEIAARLVSSETFGLARVVVGYFSLSDEVNVDPVLAKAVEEGKSALVPVVRGEGMTFAKWTPCVTLMRSGSGVLQVAEAGLDLRGVGDCLVLLPGRVFDRAGGRVGRGRGYYDRVLGRRMRGVNLAGVGYELQLVEAVPVEEHDQRVEMMFTEQGCIDCR